MDKKYAAIGALCMILALGSFYFSQKEFRRQLEEDARRAAATAEEESSAPRSAFADTAELIGSIGVAEPEPLEELAPVEEDLVDPSQPPPETLDEIQPGADLVSGEATFGHAIFRDRSSRVHFVPSGTVQPDPEVVPMVRLDTVLSALSRTYDIMVLDATDPMIGMLGRECDVAVVVMRPLTGSI